MLTSTKQLICALAALVATVSASRAQEARAGAPSGSTKATVATPAIGSGAAARSAELAPTKLVQASPVVAHERGVHGLLDQRVLEQKSRLVVILFSNQLGVLDIPQRRAKGKGRVGVGV